MTSQTFRDSLNSLGWTRRDDVPVNTSQQTGLLSSLQSLNPFGDSGHVRLPTNEGPAMMGPWSYVKHLASGPRLPFTGAYFGSIALTLYFSIGLHSTILTLISAVIQLACLLWYLVSYFPMGSSGLRLATTFGARRAAAWMTG
ncbi:sft2 domain-containing protein [Ophiostoma piceae UAMH 11346]|uniref:Protein transport protein SFT2 n=1 Tax=Ophiostoma piceae (strain UAMH 11346) TaxID=1262450 RepID=S3CBA3_OPHP1|nr:sft2 domain-containing protein [Ophiostoma piceae UAMH 11346]